MGIFGSETATVVFWDVDDFPIPPDRKIDSVYAGIQSALKNEGYLGGGLSIRAYSKKDMCLDGDDNGEITLVSKDVDKYTRLDKMSFDFFLWALERNSPYRCGQHIAMVLSKKALQDTEFAYALRPLYYSQFTILSALSDSCALQVPAYSAKSVWLWTSLLDGGMSIKEGLLSRIQPIHLSRSCIGDAEAHKVLTSSQVVDEATSICPTCSGE